MTRRNEKLPRLWADAGCSASWWGVGPPVSGFLHLPLLCCGGSDRWSPKGSCSTPSDASSVCPALSLPGLKAMCQGNMGTLPGTQPSTATRVNCLQRGVAPLPILPTNTLLPPRGRVQLLQLCFKDVVEWRQFFIQMKYALSRSCQMPNLNLSTLETSCKGLISQ